MNRKSIVHVTTVHSRQDIRIFSKECRSLSGAGYAVTLLVSDGLGDECRPGVRIVDVGPRPAGRLSRLAKQGRSVEAVLRSLSPALVHLHDPELLSLAR